MEDGVFVNPVLYEWCAVIVPLVLSYWGMNWTREKLIESYNSECGSAMFDIKHLPKFKLSTVPWAILTTIFSTIVAIAMIEMFYMTGLVLN